MSSSQPIFCVPKRTHRVIRRTPRVCLKNSVLSLPKVTNKVYEILRRFMAVVASSASRKSLIDTEYDRAKVPPYNGSDPALPLEV